MGQQNHSDLIDKARIEQLERIDKLRELGVGDEIKLPQVCSMLVQLVENKILSRVCKDEEYTDGAVKSACRSWRSELGKGKHLTTQ